MYMVRDPANLIKTQATSEAIHVAGASTVAVTSPEDAEIVTFKLRISCGDTFTMKLPGGTTVDDLQGRVCKEVGAGNIVAPNIGRSIDKSRVRMMLAGRKLKHTQRLSTMSLVPTSHIQVFLMPPMYESPKKQMEGNKVLNSPQR
jgi:hypothetical protein